MNQAGSWPFWRELNPDLADSHPDGAQNPDTHKLRRA